MIAVALVRVDEVLCVLPCVCACRGTSWVYVGLGFARAPIRSGWTDEAASERGDDMRASQV